MEEKPDLVDLVGAVFRRRTFNVESLTIGQMEQPGVSCVPIVVDGHHTDLEKALRHLHRLARVIKAQTRNRGRPDAMQRADTFSARMIDAGLDTLIAGVTNTDTKIKGMFAVPETIGARETVYAVLLSLTDGGRDPSGAPSSTELRSRSPGFSMLDIALVEHADPGWLICGKCSDRR